MGGKICLCIYIGRGPFFMGGRKEKTETKSRKIPGQSRANLLYLFMCFFYPLFFFFFFAPKMVIFRGSSEEESSACTSCSPGEVANETGRSSCSQCEPGSFTSAGGGVACEMCSPGSRAPGLAFTLESSREKLCTPPSLPPHLFAKRHFSGEGGGVYILSPHAAGSLYAPPPPFIYTPHP